MLNINTAFAQNKKQSRVSFGTNLIVGQGVVEHLNKNPQELQKIQEFKEYLAKDGKNWNAELTYDTFTPTSPSPLAESETQIRKSSTHYDYEPREAASKLISQMKSEDAAALIKKLSTDKEIEVQAMAASHAIEIKDKKIALALIEELLQSPNQRIKEEILYSLESIKDETLKNKMVEKYINSDDAVIKKGIIKVGNNSAGTNAFNKDLEKFSKDTDPEIRQTVFRKILALSNEEYDKNSNLYDSIIKAGLKDSESQVKEIAGEAIGRLKDPNEAAKLINETIENSTESWSRRYIASSARFIKDSMVAEPLIQKLLTHYDSNVRTGAAHAAMQSENPEIRAKFAEQLANNPNPSIRREVSFAIHKIKDATQQKAILEKLLKDPDASVRNSVAWSTCHIDDTNLRDSLINKYIKSDDFDIKQGTLETLSYIQKEDFEKAKEFAQILAKDPDKALQKEANRILDKIKSEAEQDHYNLKITDGSDVIGNKIVKDDENIFDSFFNAYKAIFEKAAK